MIFFSGYFLHYFFLGPWKHFIVVFGRYCALIFCWNHVGSNTGMFTDSIFACSRYFAFAYR